MHRLFITRYAASWQMMLWVGLVYGLFIFLGWYVFVKRLGMVAAKPPRVRSYWWE